jgi:GNAT superfamily N-acetyltransferase
VIWDGAGPEAARVLWRTLAGDPAALVPGTTTVVRGSRGLCPPGWVGVVRLGDAVVIEAGDASDADLKALGRLDDPSDPAEVGDALDPAETLGPGVLAYLPAATPQPSAAGWPTEGAIDEVAVATLTGWLGTLPTEDVEESSIPDMDRVLVLRRDGEVVGAAGHLDWPSDVSHVGLLVAPSARGGGVGTVLGAAATRRALAAGRTPQWRAAAWNSASRAVARHLGYREIGRQYSFRLR